MATEVLAKGAGRRTPRQNVALIVGGLVVLFLIVWIVFVAVDTPAGSAISDPEEFVVTVLNALTIAGLYFVVASGFTLIFGLMRVVNLAHGSLFLLGGYVALELVRLMTGRALGITSGEVPILSWVVPLAFGALVAGLMGLVIQQVFLRWFQGQELRETLITIAISIIMADQMLRFFGGIALTIPWPAVLRHFPTVAGVRYPTTRLFILGVAIVVGIGLWAWLQKTRTGMVIRAGVDDTPMVQALGINVQVVFALAFFVGAALAGIGGVLGGSFQALKPGEDGLWLLNSIIVVIVGGLGSLKGAAAGSLLLGFITAFSPAYLPAALTHYAIIVIFVLLAVVLAVRPYGLYGRPE